VPTARPRSNVPDPKASHRLVDTRLRFHPPIQLGDGTDPIPRAAFEATCVASWARAVAAGPASSPSAGERARAAREGRAGAAAAGGARAPGSRAAKADTDSDPLKVPRIVMISTPSSRAQCPSSTRSMTTGPLPGAFIRFARVHPTTRRCPRLPDDLSQMPRYQLRRLSSIVVIQLLTIGRVIEQTVPCGR